MDASEPDPPNPAPGAVESGWYLRAFGARYLDLYRGRTDEQAVAEVEAVLGRLPLSAGATVLDLCCGAGRHLVPLMERGMRVFGLDRSGALLARARERVAGFDGECRLVQGDMRRLPFGPSFDAVLSFFTSFGYFFDDDENAMVLAEASRVLREDGRFVMDLLDKASTVEGLVPESERIDGDRRIVERRWITADGRRVEKSSVVTEGDDVQRFTESVRLYEPEEIAAELDRQGLSLVEFTGDLAGSSHVAGQSRRMVVWARRVAR